MADYYDERPGYVTVPIRAGHLDAFKRFARDRNPDGIDEVVLIDVVLTEHLAQPTVASELGRLREKDEADAVKARRDEERRILEGHIRNGSSEYAIRQATEALAALDEVA